MQKKYIVRLTDEERNQLHNIVKTLKGTPSKVKRANILLKADAEGRYWTNQHIADACAQNVKKHGMTQRKIQSWVIPPESDCEHVAAMEMILETYAQPYDATRPVICMDEQPMQFQKEVRVPIPATDHHPKRVDYEYERGGTAAIFMFTEPLTGWRQTTARLRRTKVDWAQEVKHLL